MDDGRTEPFEPYQPETSYEWDYEDEPPKGPAPKILWGRILAIAGVFLLAFVLGRATAGGGGVSQESYDLLKKRNESLQTQLAAAAAASPPADASESPAPVASSSVSSTAGKEKHYTVQPGDTLRGIAQKYYGDPALDDVIAAANDITDAASIRAGQVLVIPPKP